MHACSKPPFWIVWVSVLFLIHAPAAPAREALRGVALIVGNSEYEALDPLANPGNDADAIEALLDELGFETELSTDRNARRLQRDLNNFLEDAADADVALFYYAGHGIEAGGENFIVPVDAGPGDRGGKLIPLNGFLQDLRQSVPVAIVLLDACRTNPFPGDFRLQMAAGTEPVAVTGAGLAVPASRGVFPLHEDDGRVENLATVIGFAAEPGRAALDGAPGANSPYAAALLRHVGAIDGEDFSTVMSIVAEEVYLKTKGRQQPWVNQSLRRYLFFGSAQKLDSEAADLTSERRQLLLHIAAIPARQRMAVRRLSESGDVPMDLVFAVMRAAGIPASADPAIVETRLKAEIDRIARARAARAAFSSPDAEVLRLTRLADAAEQEGALNTALRYRGMANARVDTLQSTTRKAQIENLKARILEDAEVYALSAQTKTMLYQYAAAAADYKTAFRLVADWNRGRALRYRLRQMDALKDAYVEQNDVDALIAWEQAARKELHRPTVQWNDKHNIRFLRHAGHAATQQYERTGDAAYFDAAKDYFERALAQAGDRDALQATGARHDLGQLILRRAGKSTQAEDVPLAAEYLRGWSETQRPHILLRAVIRQNEVARREHPPDSEEVRQVTEKLKSLLTPSTSKRLGYYASSLSDIGHAWSRLGELNSDPDLEDEALAAFFRAILIQSVLDVPGDMASTLLNRACLYFHRADRGDTASVGLAFADYQAALNVISPQTHPVTYEKVFDALVKLAVAHGQHLTEAQLAAIAGYSGTLQKGEQSASSISRDMGLLIYAQAQKAADLASYRTALERFDKLEQDWKNTPEDYGNSLFFKGAIHHQIGDLTGDPEPYRTAIGHLVRAGRIFDQQNDRAMSVSSRSQQGASELGLAGLSGKLDRYRAASDSFEYVLARWSLAANGQDWLSVAKAYADTRQKIAGFGQGGDIGQLDAILTEIGSAAKTRGQPLQQTDFQIRFLEGYVQYSIAQIRQNAPEMREAAHRFADAMTIEWELAARNETGAAQPGTTIAYVSALHLHALALALAAEWTQDLADFRRARSAYERLLASLKDEQALDQFGPAANGLASVLILMNRVARNDDDLDRAVELSKIALHKSRSP